MLARVLARQHVRAVYQPIIRLADGGVAGYEALARPSTVADDGSVEDFFSTATRQGVIKDLDWVCRRAALDSARAMQVGAFLSINLNADALDNAKDDSDVLMQLIDASGRSPSTVVLEVVRPAAIAALDELMERLSVYRRRGVRLALAGVDERDESVLTQAVQTPEYIKLARSLVARLDTAPAREFTARCAHRATGGCTVIAEGIETVEALRRVMDAGIAYGQGFLLGRPAPMDDEGRLLSQGTGSLGGSEAAR